MNVNITTEPEFIQRPAALFLYLQKTGSFLVNAPLAWREFWPKMTPALRELVTGMAGLGKAETPDPNASGNIYQAGVTLKSKPAQIPEGLQIREMSGGKMARFVLTGPYNQLSVAYCEIFKILAERQIYIRKDFCAEFYLNDPSVTPEANLLTEILIPIN